MNQTPSIRQVLLKPRRMKYAIIAAIVALSVMTVILLTQLGNKVAAHERNESLKYILQWTLPHTIPFTYMKVGQATFIARNCSAQNCFVTSEKKYFEDITDFDAIAFHGPEIIIKQLKSPDDRSSNQKYIFVSIESSSNYPMCKNTYDFFFNWTWTYKLNSDISYKYLIIRNNRSEVIGPAKDMHWMKVDDMLTVGPEIKANLMKKTKAAAWFVSICVTFSKRENFVKELQAELQTYGLEIDIYGKCGDLKCSISAQKDCWKMVERDYYFYLSFENSFSEDYVTEKLLNPLQHYTVPIVYGGANYTRFMPDGIYLDALKLGVKELARQMNEIIKDRKRFESFFKWHNYYSYHDPEEKPETDPYCNLCAMLNDEDAVDELVEYKYFQNWWNEPNTC